MTRPILLVGAGRMGGALLKGWIARGIGPVVVVEPATSPELRKVARAHRIDVHATADSVRTRPRACVVALKPQVLRTEAAQLTSFAQCGTLMISIAAGTTIKNLSRTWGRTARIVRAMPNTPGAIGKGISALFAGTKASAADRKLSMKLLAPLGKTLWVKREALIDSVTAVSGSGPAYVFLLVEALAEAACHEGLPQAQAQQLARATIVGAGALLEADNRSPTELRQAVTSPGGTTQAALDVLLAKDGLKPLIVRAVHGARKRAEELGR